MKTLSNRAAELAQVVLSKSDASLVASMESFVQTQREKHPEVCEIVKAALQIVKAAAR